MSNRLEATVARDLAAKSKVALQAKSLEDAARSRVERARTRRERALWKAQKETILLAAIEGKTSCAAGSIAIQPHQLLRLGFELWESAISWDRRSGPQVTHRNTSSVQGALQDLLKDAAQLSPSTCNLIRRRAAQCIKTDGNPLDLLERMFRNGELGSADVGLLEPGARKLHLALNEREAAVEIAVREMAKTNEQRRFFRSAEPQTGSAKVRNFGEQFVIGWTKALNSTAWTQDRIDSAGAAAWIAGVPGQKLLNVIGKAIRAAAMNGEETAALAITRKGRVWMTRSRRARNQRSPDPSSVKQLLELQGFHCELTWQGESIAELVVDWK